MLGICLALAALLAVNAFASALAALAWRAMRARAAVMRADARARLLFTLRILPPALAAVFVFALVVPAYVLLEPPHTGETVSPKLLLFAAASAAGVLLALWRVAGTWRVTRKFEREWMSRAEPVSVEGMEAPAYRIRHRFPVIAVVGVLRPRLFIASQIFDELTPEELRAALAHERGHVEARDNLKRALLRASDDALLVAPLGRALARTWRKDSEMAADEFAASESPCAALNLASAIVKISRMIPAGARPTLPAGAHLLGEDEDGLSKRVRHLLKLASAGVRARARRRPMLSWAFRFALVAAFLLAVTRTEVLAFTHTAIEHVVAYLK
ncbi:MAG TPA: M56 family metallopeptidase [Pyrinomonadaceae bacterium]|jgi:beta-lactamase regulating signal transducer with metallopeptidase domain|nr:M56 family metallopeptidase [Pyrinomonadaceae bacterium]